jgi:hypothetical protein
MSEQTPSGSTAPRDRGDEVDHTEKQKFGGIKFGVAFFGWLAATGMAVLLTALLSAIGIGVGLTAETDPNQVAQQATESATAVGLVSAIVLALIVFVSYFCGGYVAGRMARFDGAWPCGCGRSSSPSSWRSWAWWPAASSTCSGSSAGWRACPSTRGA